MIVSIRGQFTTKIKSQVPTLPAKTYKNTYKTGVIITKTSARFKPVFNMH